jgi:hypothetical protein
MIKVPPMMGARARGKLNKRGLAKQPGNMRGLTAPAMGGLAAASRDKGKMRRPVGFARGSEGEPVGGLDYSDLLELSKGRPLNRYFDDIYEITAQSKMRKGELQKRKDKFHADVAAAPEFVDYAEQMESGRRKRFHDEVATANSLAEQMESGRKKRFHDEVATAKMQRDGFSGQPFSLDIARKLAPTQGLVNDFLANPPITDEGGGLASAPTEIKGGLASENVKQQSHASTTPQAKAEAMTESDALAQLRAAVLRAQARREQPQGNVNIPLLLAAGAMSAPTRTGSYFEALGNAMTAGGNALAGQRKTDEEQARSGEDMNIELLKAEVARQDAMRKQQLDEAYRYADLDNRMKAAQARSSMGGGSGGGGVVMAQINQRAADLMDMNPGKYTPAQARHIAYKERNGALRAQYNAIFKAKGQNAANAFAIENGLMDAVTAPDLDEVYGDSTGSGQQTESSKSGQVMIGNKSISYEFE